MILLDFGHFPAAYFGIKNDINLFLLWFPKLLVLHFPWSVFMSGRAQYIVRAGRTPKGERGRARLLIWTFWIWCIWFIWAWFPFSLGMSGPLIYLCFTSLPFPKPNTRGAVNATKWGASFPAQPSPNPCPCPVQAVPQVWLHTCLILPLLTVFPRITSFWDTPYLFLISSVPQIELCSSSSKEVPYTFD